MDLKFSMRTFSRKGKNKLESFLWLTLTIKIHTLQLLCLYKLDKTILNYSKLTTRCPKFSNNSHWLAVKTQGLTLCLLLKDFTLTKVVQICYSNKSKAEIVKKQELTGKPWHLSSKKDFSSTKLLQG